jgi:hypothetical protein
VYKAGKLKELKQAQENNRSLHYKNLMKENERSVIRQELYGEVSDKELDMIADAFMELESPNSLRPSDSKRKYLPHWRTL